MQKSLKKKASAVVLASFCAACSMPMAAFAAENSAAKLPLTALTEEQVAQFSSNEIIVKQTKIEQDILAEFNAGSYNLYQPLVKVNPYGGAPLAALVLFDTAEETTVDITVCGKDPSVDIKHSFKQYGIHHEIPVYGLYANDYTKVVITTTTKNGVSESNTLSIKTPALPDVTRITAETLVKDQSQMVDGLTICTSVFNTDVPIVGFDANGDIRAAFTEIGNGNTPFVRMDNNRILAISKKVIRGLYYGASFYETDLMGKVYKEYLVNGIHHDVIKLSNGNFLVDAEKAGSKTTEDYLVEIDGATGAIVREFDLKAIFPMKNYEANPYYNFNKEDWLHVNSIWAVPGEDAILVSARQQDAIFKVDLAKKELVWVISAADPDDFSDEVTNKLLTPVGGEFEYTWGQHAISMLPDGRIFVFDNGDARSKNKDTMLSDKLNYSRAVIYHVDEKAKTVEQVWQYGKERGNELYSSYICDVDYLGPNHYLIDFGGISTSGNIMEAGGRIAHIIELKDDVVVNEIVVNDNIYRAERLKAYELDKEYQLTKEPGKQFGKLYTGLE